MNKIFEHVLLGIGGLFFAASILFWFAVFASPFIFVYWSVIQPMLPQWSVLNTFGLLLAVGLVSFILLVATWGYNDKAVN